MLCDEEEKDNAINNFMISAFDVWALHAEHTVFTSRPAEQAFLKFRGMGIVLRDLLLAQDKQKRTPAQ